MRVFPSHPYRLFFLLALGCLFGQIDSAAAAPRLKITDGNYAELLILPKLSGDPRAHVLATRKESKASPNDVALRLRLARNLMVIKDYTDAIDVLKTLNSEVEPRALILLERVYELNSDWLEQIRTLEILRKRFPQLSITASRLSTAFFKSGNTKKAVEALREGIKSSPKDKELYFQLLDLYDQTKNSYESRILLGDMVQLFGNDGAVLTSLCRVYARNSFLEDGLLICARAIEIVPQVAENHVYLGLLKVYSKETAQGEKIIRKAAQQFPRSELAQKIAAQSYESEKDFEGAARLYTRCVGAHKKSAECWLGLGNATFLASQFDRALKALSTACNYSPTAARNELRNSATQLRLKNKIELADQFTRAFERCGSN